MNPREGVALVDLGDPIVNEELSAFESRLGRLEIGEFGLGPLQGDPETSGGVRPSLFQSQESLTADQERPSPKPWHRDAGPWDVPSGREGLFDRPVHDEDATGENPLGDVDPRHEAFLHLRHYATRMKTTRRAS